MNTGISAGWFIYVVGALAVSGIATAIATGKMSAGVAVFTFGFVLPILADEIAVSIKRSAQDKERK